MVAVPATQPGATYRTFDTDRFLHNVADPVKAFLSATNGVCPVLLYFCAGDEPHLEEIGSYYPPECGQPPFPGTPGHAAAIRYFAYEVEKGHVWMTVIVDRQFTNAERFVEKLMRERGVEDPRIFTPGRLSNLTAELNGVDV